MGRLPPCSSHWMVDFLRTLDRAGLSFVPESLSAKCFVLQTVMWASATACQYSSTLNLEDSSSLVAARKVCSSSTETIMVSTNGCDHKSFRTSRYCWDQVKASSSAGTGWPSSDQSRAN